jgi:hypothetical protein
VHVLETVVKALERNLDLSFEKKNGHKKKKKK